MAEIKIYVANLGKYNEGELVGDWFTLPTDIEEIQETIGVADGTEYEEMAIHDYEAPFSIGEYDSINELNDIAERMNSLSDDEANALGEIIDNGFASDLEDAIDLLEGDVIWYHDCNDMSDVAYHYYEETGMMSEIPDHLQGYIDWDKVGRDMDIEGSFLEIEFGTFIQVLR